MALKQLFLINNFPNTILVILINNQFCIVSILKLNFKNLIYFKFLEIFARIFFFNFLINFLLNFLNNHYNQDIQSINPM